MHVYFDREPIGYHANVWELCDEDLEKIYGIVCKLRNDRMQAEANKNLERERK